MLVFNICICVYVIIWFYTTIKGNNMSHMSLMVITDELDEVEEALIPFASQTDSEYMEFLETETENREDYRNKTLNAKRLPDGTLTHEYDEKYRSYDMENFGSQFIFPEGTQTIVMTMNEFYPTFEEYMEKWCGSEERDEIKGVFGYWHNPNSQYDWFQIGGRWTGYFKPKSGVEGLLGEPGSFDNQPREGWCDALKIKDIDLEAMQEIARVEANEEYDKVEALIAGRELPSWSKIRKEQGEDYKKAQDIYAQYQVVKDFKEANVHVWGGLFEAYGKNREDFVQKRVNNVLRPFAILVDGVFTEHGWDDKTSEQWSEEFFTIFNNLDPEKYVTLVDYHN